MTLTFTEATQHDLPRISELEASSYHVDEAASEERLRDRIGYALESPVPQLLFIVAKDKDEIVGYACSTLAVEDLVTDASMATHDPNGKTVCLHSVCVSPTRRKQGIASQILLHWIELHRQQRLYNRIALLSRPNLVPLYKSVGFVEIGQSDVVHGPIPWIDCILDL
ncbi:acyl-CoA N-acyltransferase [Gongronella butleri]|nr:acyl-CoA N-acyltransferase [Gongronella butleri]